MENQENKESFIEKALHLFMENYLPCDTPDKATHYFTTAEILQFLNDIYPDESFNSEEIVLFLEQYAYIYMPEPNKMGLRLKWLTIKKQ